MWVPPSLFLLTLSGCCSGNTVRASPSGNPSTFLPLTYVHRAWQGTGETGRAQVSLAEGQRSRASGFWNLNLDFHFQLCDPELLFSFSLK